MSKRDCERCGNSFDVQIKVDDPAKLGGSIPLESEDGAQSDSGKPDRSVANASQDLSSADRSVLCLDCQAKASSSEARKLLTAEDDDRRLEFKKPSRKETVLAADLVRDSNRPADHSRTSPRLPNQPVPAPRLIPSRPIGPMQHEQYVQDEQSSIGDRATSDSTTTAESPASRETHSDRKSSKLQEKLSSLESKAESIEQVARYPMFVVIAVICATLAFLAALIIAILLIFNLGSQ